MIKFNDVAIAFQLWDNKDIAKDIIYLPIWKLKLKFIIENKHNSIKKMK